MLSSSKNVTHFNSFNKGWSQNHFKYWKKCRKYPTKLCQQISIDIYVLRFQKLTNYNTFSPYTSTHYLLGIRTMSTKTTSYQLQKISSYFNWFSIYKMPLIKRQSLEAKIRTIWLKIELINKTKSSTTYLYLGLMFMLCDCKIILKYKCKIIKNLGVRFTKVNTLFY